MNDEVDELITKLINAKKSLEIKEGEKAELLVEIKSLKNEQEALLNLIDEKRN